ncbi:unnamed protein product [Callosobruchus maculatus]|uniref:6-phosphogluconate dehydrogenase NADP-binding domain-containing protein n=1 Tax=Callosobruchus maculatus TaxID=64391 RepID=A0A653CCT2_CALMS|nr:unnamed protein product [Callosobruchus maculatus]
MKKIGVLGGHIAGIGFETSGLLIVQQLVEAKHIVTIWSEDRRHCRGLRKLSKYKNNPTISISQEALLRRSDLVFLFSVDHNDVERWIGNNFEINAGDEKILEGNNI